MYSPLRVNLKGYNEVGEPILYDLQLYGTVTIIEGDSGTGKTLMCTVAKQMIAAGNMHIITFDTGSRSNLRESVLNTYKNMLIIIDNADLIVKGKVLNYILHDENNHYILFRRGNYDVELSPNYYAEIKKNAKGIRELVYLSKNPRWY